jgi:hypothetical protein
MKLHLGRSKTKYSQFSHYKILVIRTFYEVHTLCLAHHLMGNLPEIFRAKLNTANKNTNKGHIITQPVTEARGRV